MLSDWISVLQLSCAISIALGAYEATRSKREAQGSEMLQKASDKIEELISSDNGNNERNIDSNEMLNDVPWAAMSNRDLGDYKRDISIRFWQLNEEIRQRDKIRNYSFLSTGTISAFLLIVASAIPRTEFNPILGAFCAIILLGLPIASIVSIWIEERRLAWMIEPNDPSGHGGNSRSIKPRSRPQKGQMYHVCNEIRRRKLKK